MINQGLDWNHRLVWHPVFANRPGVVESSANWPKIVGLQLPADPNSQAGKLANELRFCVAGPAGSSLWCSVRVPMALLAVCKIDVVQSDIFHCVGVGAAVWQASCTRPAERSKRSGWVANFYSR